MARKLLTSLALVVAAVIAAQAAGATASPASTQSGARLVHGGPPPADYVPGQVLVRFRAGARAVARASALRRPGVSSSRAVPLTGLRLVRLERGASVREATSSLERDPAVAYAQPNHYYRLAALPNDPRFGELWGLHDTGQVVEGTAGTPGADIHAPEAWDLTTGSRAVVVAVADSGIAYDHPDLAPNLWANPGESGGGRESNGRDDDHNGLVDDWRGWDFVGNDNDPRDLNGHGTHVAGIIGARGNNGEGVAGVDWQVSLMPLRVADSSGIVTDSAIASAFDYAAAKGARVVNASFVSSAYSPALRDAIRTHPKVLFVAAAGNGDPDGIGDDNDSTPQYPCSLTLVNLLCVAASDQLDALTSFSNFGRTSVDLAAPGQSILSAAPAFGAPLFSDGFETELAGIWQTGGTHNGWARITTVAHSGSYSLSDSPGTTYENNTDSFVRTVQPFSLGGQVGCRVNYALRLSTEPDVDKLLVELSQDGTNWSVVNDWSGSSLGQFLELSDDISAFDGAPSVWLRFHLVTNGSGVADGAQLDDVSARCLSSSYAGTEFLYNDGTSMAAPHVTGVAALVLARYPGLGVEAVREAILRGVDAKATLAGKVASGGRLNARGALVEAGKLVPKLRLGGAKLQHVLRTRAIVLYVRCNERCVAVVNGKIRLTGASRSRRLKRVSRSLPAGKRKKLVIRLSRPALGSVRRTLAHNRRVTAKLSVLATDRRGSHASAKREIRLGR